ncbi:MAG TPA: 4-(cytidine 5'-diphospho)-2-C-methyl-D-erythritol kinase, partial [Candidatus Berkiella sp.]|nr:4-(cytidine 5'-diphospho)-2-C-methyl-D-erythritol kinase [Candidatus Berkiella sp.]
MNTLRLPSPAKVNHFLHITGQRSDGYHLLQTCFQFVDYGDELEFILRDDKQIILKPDNMLGITNESNLIYRVAIALQTAANVTQGITITVHKQLPLGAGLGGGSSNAATTLLALNELWDLNWSVDELMALGLCFGADIPIFIKGVASLAEGIGEQLTPITLNESWLAIITPPCQVISAKMYADSELTRNTPAFRIGHLAKGEFKNNFSELRNDFEPLVRRRYPEVDDAMKWLSNFGKPRLSGSGASVFAC